MFNLIPIFPLDGGRIVEIVLSSVLGKMEGKKIVHIISNISVICITALSIFGAIYLKNIALVTIVIYLWIITVVENKKYRLTKRLYNTVSTYFK